MSGASPGPGLLASLRRLLDTALEIAQVRLELLADEIGQEKRRLFDALLWCALALLLLGAGLTLLTALLLMLLWEGYRLGALALLSTLYLAGGFALAQLARRRLAGPGRVGADSLGELARDRAALSRGVE